MTVRDASDRPSPDPAESVTVDVRAPGEWIASGPGAGPSLHVYRLDDADWLVSEVGRHSEGRGDTLAAAIAALSLASAPPSWWSALAEMLDPDAGVPPARGVSGPAAGASAL